MFKKLVIAGATAGLLLTTAIPAFGHSFTVNKAHVWSDVGTMSQSGGNEIKGGVVNGGTIYTAPSTGTSLVGHLVNTNLGTHGMTINKAHVATEVTTSALSGGNTIEGGVVNGGYINSGPSTAGTVVVDVVNTNLNFH